MKQRTRIYYSEKQKPLMWDQWEKGESLHSHPVHRYDWNILVYLFQVCSDYLTVLSVRKYYGNHGDY